MPTVTIKLSDTPTGAVKIDSDYKPAVGAACSPAQAAALEIIARTRRDWGMPILEAAAAKKGGAA